MKKLLLILLIATIPFFSSMKFAQAADDCGNIFLGSFDSTLYKNDEAVTDSTTYSKDSAKPIDNVVQLVGRTQNGSLTNMYTLFGGTVGKCYKASANVTTFLQQKASPGLAQAVGSVAMQSFFSSPSSDIGAHYANMLLPKEFINQGGSTAYAAAVCDDGSSIWTDPLGNIGRALSLTKPPKCESASVYWKDLGLSKMWSVSFSLAMGIVVLVLIISGLMIMFRSKAGGQATVTVSMALQNVIIASVMALASFALGVFFVNLSKVLMLVIGNLLLSALWKDMPVIAVNLFGLNISSKLGWGDLFGTTYLSDPLGLAGKLMIVLFAGDLAKFAGESAGILSFGSSFGSVFGAIGEAFVSIGGLMAHNALATLMSPIYIIVRLIIMGAILIVSIRIVWTVIKTYISMAIDVVIAPVLFVVSAIPGKSNAVSEWLKRMFMNAIIPPLMFALVNITVYITFALAITSSGGTDQITAVTGGALPPSVLGLAAFAIGPQSIVMIVLLNLVPTIPTIVKDMFSGKSSGGVEKATGEMMKSLQKIPVAGALFN